MNNVIPLHKPEAAPTFDEWVAAGLGHTFGSGPAAIAQDVVVNPKASGVVLQFAPKVCKDWNTTLTPEHLLGLAQWFTRSNPAAAWHFTAIWVAQRHPDKAAEAGVELNPFTVDIKELWEYCYWNEVDVWGIKPVSQRTV